MQSTPLDLSSPLDTFVHRHIGPREDELKKMLTTAGASSLEALIAETIPTSIRTKGELDLGKPRGEHELLQELLAMAKKNEVKKSYLGMGYYDTVVPPVIQRNILENPGWYTQYTPYQAEISQGRLESLLNFQTLVSDLCALPVSNASLLDEATAAAEAMHLCKAASADASKTTFLVADDCHPQNLAVVKTRAEALGLKVETFDPSGAVDFAAKNAFGVLVQYPGTDGRLLDYRELIQKAHAASALVVMATDLLALTMLVPPGELGADVAVGSAQRFGVPLGFGGPHAAFFATSDKHKRIMPGRLVGVSKDAQGKSALRLAMQTREQHIRREKATSNICTAQALLANMAAMYAVYHGPHGLLRIAERVHGLAKLLAAGARELGLLVTHASFFDTVRIEVASSDAVITKAEAAGMNLRKLSASAVGISLDETTTLADVRALLAVLGQGKAVNTDKLAESVKLDLGAHKRTSAYLTHPVFNTHHSETEMLRYMRKLEQKDLALNVAMIPLGSCTMKLNATSEMLPVSWPEFGKIHPFAPSSQTAGYRELFTQLERMIAQVTGFAGVSLQPNAGSQGEYAGLLVIRKHHEANGQGHRNVCLIPQSAHGTNPASAALAGMQVVVVATDVQGNVDVQDLEKKAKEHKDKLSCLMITYPSTHGVFEEAISDICRIVHQNGGQVYMDGANLNAQVGLVKPGEIGADVCHLNLHKTFAIPHGGGGPGMGPIAVAKHLLAYLPSHPVIKTGGEQGIGAVSAAPHGSASILTISWVYMMLMGASGLRRATEMAILNANYMAKRLEPHYPIVYRGKNGRVAHEFILDLRPWKARGVEAEDVAKRLMDYGFHAPTMSFPVVGTLMIEPTESEPLSELDRFCDAMIAIRGEIEDIATGKVTPEMSPLKNAPHTAQMVTAAAWPYPYSREVAAFPTAAVKDNKYWPTVARVDNAYGDRNLVCTCPPIESYT